MYSSPTKKYSSSSGRSDSSSDDFPSPKSPKKRNGYRTKDPEGSKDLSKKVTDLHRRLYEAEIKIKKLTRK
jgi:hypothetical protein